MSSLNPGDYCIVYDTWRDPYRINGKIEYETCLELTVGKVSNPNSLTFSESFNLNSYHGSLSFTASKSVAGNSTSSKIIIPLERFVSCGLSRKRNFVQCGYGY